MGKAVRQFRVVWTEPPAETAVIQAATRALRNRDHAATVTASAGGIPESDGDPGSICPAAPAAVGPAVAGPAAAGAGLLQP